MPSGRDESSMKDASDAGIKVDIVLKQDQRRGFLSDGANPITAKKRGKRFAYLFQYLAIPALSF